MTSVILSNALRLPLRRPTPNPIVVSERHAALHALACSLWSRGVGSGDLDVSTSLLRRGMKTKTRYFEPLNEKEDVIETFIKGSGKGGQVRSCKTAAADGQAINKRSTNVSLIHKPTGIRVTCQDTRSLETNRLLARKRLVEQIDLAKNGDKAVLRVKEAEASFRKARLKAQKARKRRAKAEAKLAAAGDAGDASKTSVEPTSELET